MFAEYSIVTTDQPLIASTNGNVFDYRKASSSLLSVERASQKERGGRMRTCERQPEQVLKLSTKTHRWALRRHSAGAADRFRTDPTHRVAGGFSDRAPVVARMREIARPLGETPSVRRVAQRGEYGVREDGAFGDHEMLP
ncbi:MAG TPA: hypothetical protein VGS96_13430, partial [Thermoanaerobaculia bacterium]|nr:hypothetical protein [Thermoanaerobaculia bacterium]